MLSIIQTSKRQIQIVGFLKMGANLSSMENAHISSKSSCNILTFHSTAKWKAHFDASKEINKLVCMILQLQVPLFFIISFQIHHPIFSYLFW